MKSKSSISGVPNLKNTDTTFHAESNKKINVLKSTQNVEEKKLRKIEFLQLMRNNESTYSYVIATCNDGTFWYCYPTRVENNWVKLKDIPQDI